MWLDIGIVLVYLAVLVGMGLRGGRQVKSAGDFTASGGRYGTWVLFASLSASFIGGGYSSGNAARAFESGIGTTLALFGFSLSMILIGRLIVPGGPFPRRIHRRRRHRRCLWEKGAGAVRLFHLPVQRGHGGRADGSHRPSLSCAAGRQAPDRRAHRLRHRADLLHRRGLQSVIAADMVQFYPAGCRHASAAGHVPDPGRRRGSGAGGGAGRLFQPLQRNHPGGLFSPCSSP